MEAEIEQFVRELKALIAKYGLKLFKVQQAEAIIHAEVEVKWREALFNADKQKKVKDKSEGV